MIGRRGQSSVEYMIVFAAALVVLASAVHYLITSSKSVGKSAERAVNRVYEEVENRIRS
ncbi:hypothetical protein DRN52_06220 [Thermococci archaeon]|nr:MAG: hypothetical protein DRN52_06220 [Thermococci archaeon]